MIIAFTLRTQELFCNSRSVGGNCSSEFCECVHVEKVDLRDVVEFVLVDEGKTFDANHPMHLHGYSYRVVGMGKVWRYNLPYIEAYNAI